MKNPSILKWAIFGAFLMTSFLLCDGQWMNSTLACTQGSEQTRHDIDCGLGVIIINRVMYGATNISSECNRTTPYENCCMRNDTMEECVFESDVELDVVLKLCSGKAACNLPGRRMYSSEGNCSAEYHDVTSFSYVEYMCMNTSELVLVDITGRTFIQATDHVYLDSNQIMQNSHLWETTRECIAFAECNATLTVTAIDLRLGVLNGTECAEELVIQDLGNSSMETMRTCHDGRYLVNTELFTSQSNVVRFELSMKGPLRGGLLLRLESSESSDVNVTCGIAARFILEDMEFCPDFMLDYDFSDGRNYTGPTDATVTDKESDILEAGVVVGISLGAIALVFLGVFFFNFFLKRWVKKVLLAADEEDEKASVVSQSSQPGPSVA